MISELGCGGITLEVDGSFLDLLIFASFDVEGGFRGFLLLLVAEAARTGSSIKQTQLNKFFYKK